MSFINLFSNDRWTAADIAARVALLTDVGGYTVNHARAEGVAAQADAVLLGEALDIEEAQRKVIALAAAAATVAPAAPVASQGPVPEYIPLVTIHGPAELTPAERLALAEAELQSLQAGASDELLDLLALRKPAVAIRVVGGPSAGEGSE